MQYNHKAATIVTYNLPVLVFHETYLQTKYNVKPETRNNALYTQIDLVKFYLDSIHRV